MHPSVFVALVVFSQFGILAALPATTTTPHGSVVVPPGSRAYSAPEPIATVTWGEPIQTLLTTGNVTNVAQDGEDVYFCSNTQFTGACLECSPTKNGICYNLPSDMNDVTSSFRFDPSLHYYCSLYPDPGCSPAYFRVGPGSSSVPDIQAAQDAAGIGGPSWDNAVSSFMCFAKV